MTQSAPIPTQTARTGNTRVRIVGHLLLTVLASCTSFGGFLLVMYGVRDDKRPITAMDHDLLLALHRHVAPGLTILARYLADLGEPKFIVGIGLFAALIGYFYRPVRGAAWTMPVAIVGAGILIQSVKISFKRARPDVFTPLLHETGYSFPSGHSLISIVVYGLLGYFAMHLVSQRWTKVVIGMLTLLLIVAIGVSRVYVGVHYPSDVLAGWSLGLPWLIGCLALHERLAHHYSALGEPVFPTQAASLATR